jgi:hypothetical protein
MSTSDIAVERDHARKMAGSNRTLLEQLRAIGAAPPAELERIERETRLWEQLADEYDAHLARRLSDEPHRRDPLDLPPVENSPHDVTLFGGQP